jgi:hypothetical protein
MPVLEKEVGGLLTAAATHSELPLDDATPPDRVRT